jgi:Fic family protein
MAKFINDNGLLILEIIKANPLLSSKEIHDKILHVAAYATVKRTLQGLVTAKVAEVVGNGKSTKYRLTKTYAITATIDVAEYFKKEIDERVIQPGFNLSFISTTLKQVSIFTDEEYAALNALQNIYKGNAAKLSKAAYSKELERLAIDLSWKSSQIEGNTYSLLETEHLLREKQTASGKTKDEATMLLNHKDAIDFIIENKDYVQPLTVAAIEDIHSILIKELPITRNIRNQRVGISGTNYKPLDNAFQIKEALIEMCIAINEATNVFAKSLLAILLLSYIQPFADGNKRTARIIGNAILINNNYCPISFRTVNSLDYKKAMLIFYEQNNIAAFKKIFMEQFEFAVNSYF